MLRGFSPAFPAARPAKTRPRGGNIFPGDHRDNQLLTPMYRFLLDELHRFSCGFIGHVVGKHVIIEAVEAGNNFADMHYRQFRWCLKKYKVGYFPFAHVRRAIASSRIGSKNITEDAGRNH